MRHEPRDETTARSEEGTEPRAEEPAPGGPGGASTPGGDEVYSAEEERAVARRLEALGYIE